MHEPSVARNVDLENAAAPQSSDEEADKQEKVQCSSKTNVNKKKIDDDDDEEGDCVKCNGANQREENRLIPLLISAIYQAFE